MRKEIRVWSASIHSVDSVHKHQVKSPALPSSKDGAPLYNCVGVVKRHFSILIGDCVLCGRRFFLFLTRNLFFGLTKARIVNPAVERSFHQPSIRSSTTDHDSFFELPACASSHGPQSKTPSHL